MAPTVDSASQKPSLRNAGVTTPYPRARKVCEKCNLELTDRRCPICLEVLKANLAAILVILVTVPPLLSCYGWWVGAGQSNWSARLAGGNTADMSLRLALFWGIIGLVLTVPLIVMATFNISKVIRRQYENH